MIKYTLSLKVTSNGGTYRYNVHLNQAEENQPQIYFTQEKQENLRLSLEEQSQCTISEAALKIIVSDWISAIREGYRHTVLSIDLPPITPPLPDLSEIVCLPPLDFP